MDQYKKEQLIKTIKEIYETPFMQKYLEENKSDAKWLDYLKKNYHNMSKEERLNYIMENKDETKGYETRRN